MMRSRACRAYPAMMLVCFAKTALVSEPDFFSNLAYCSSERLRCTFGFGHLRRSGKAWHRPADGKSTSDIDAAIVTDHMMLEATSLGLGSVWICWFDPTMLADELSLPASLEPVNVLAIGYASEPAKPIDRYATERIALKDILISS